jgi:hypothetical protein
MKLNTHERFVRHEKHASSELYFFKSDSEDESDFCYISTYTIGHIDWCFVDEDGFVYHSKTSTISVTPIWFQKIVTYAHKAKRLTYLFH